MFLKQNLKFNRMQPSITYRLLDCFTEAIRKRKDITEDILLPAYDEFITHLSALAEGELPIITKLRHLRRLELELDACREPVAGIQGKLTGICLAKAAAIVKMEIELLHFAVQHPEHCPKSVQTAGNPQSPKLPSLHWKGSAINLMELIASLDYSGFVMNEKGDRQSFAGMVTAFEAFFHVSLSKPYDLRADLSRRKKSLSVLLPQLREAYEKNIVNCGIDRR